MKVFFYALTILLVIMFIIPSLLVLGNKNSANNKLDSNSKNSTEENQLNEGNKTLNVSVFRTKDESVQTIELEEYVKGVLSSEMPLTFEKEALKAQAIVARTYVMNKIYNKTSAPKGADITDTINSQVYKNKDELRAEWGTKYKHNYQIIDQVVKETKGLYISYKNQPIEAFFFSTSNGYTENSEEYWAEKLPYLRSVDSPWDKQSSKYYDKRTYSVEQFEDTLNLKVENQFELNYKKSQGKRNKEVIINGKSFAGKFIRMNFKLNSTDFTITKHGDQIVFQTKGYGHGVGLSQYGANYLAQKGKTCDEIIKYYYQGVSLSSINNKDHITGKFKGP